MCRRLKAALALADNDAVQDAWSMLGHMGDLQACKECWPVFDCAEDHEGEV